MINPDITAHLEKYFRLSRTHFAEGDYALAAFFAITTIEESSKLLILRDMNLSLNNKRRTISESLRHKTKYLNALINLIDQSPLYESLPHEWKQEIESWWDTNKLMRIRNDCLYLRYSSNNQVTTPKEAIDIKLAALLAYVAGIALAELDEYITGFPPRWKKSILEVTGTFRQQYLKE